MLKGIDINQRVEFTSKEDVGEPKTIFVLRPLTGAEMINISQDYFEGNSIKLSGDSLINFIDMSVVEIKNFDSEPDKKKAIESLSPSVLAEIAGFIIEVNHLSGQERKNS